MTVWEIARKMIKMGYSPLPLPDKKKSPPPPNWQKYCAELPTEEDLTTWENKNTHANLGMALGNEVEEGFQIGAVDIDDETAVEMVNHALNTGDRTPKKKGAKGETIFVLAPVDFKNSKLRIKGQAKPSVEILLKGSQTVLPPSTHPLGMAYEWTGFNLFEKGAKLPMLDDCSLDEIKACCHGDGKHFEALNAMEWAGVDGGGDTHDVCVSAVAGLVARKWPDEGIHRRIEQAKRRATEDSGEVYSWPQSTKKIQEWIDSARSKGMTGKKKDPQIPIERLAADWVVDTHDGEEHFAAVDGVLRHYHDGHWPEINTTSVEKAMYLAFPFLKASDAKAAMKIAATLVNREQFGDDRSDFVCLLNGTLNLTTGELDPHALEHSLLHQLPFEWDPEATCPKYEEIVSVTFGADEKAIDLWDEYCALSLVKNMSYQKILFLFGPGGNGKGTLARVLQSLHDPASVGSVGITELDNERKRTSLVGKLINISGEQSRLNLVSDTYLKKITGGDPIDVRRLYGETKSGVFLQTRFLELVNEMPKTTDNSYALKRRLIILPCNYKVLKPDKELDAKLAAEKPGILKRFSVALRRLYKRGHFEEPASSTEVVDEYMVENDQVAMWLEQSTIPSDGVLKGESSKELYSHFLSWTRESGYRFPVTKGDWGKAMKRLQVESTRRRFTSGGRPQRGWMVELIDAQPF